jgi:hypothetical protein
MAGKKAKQKLQAWSEARARHHLTDAQVKMARELGMNPARLGKIDNHGQEKWKRPLPEFIEDAYRKRFGRTNAPLINISISTRIKRQRRRIKKQRRRRRTNRTAASRPRVRSGKPLAARPSHHFRSSV